jgi:hypothetical protein
MSSDSVKKYISDAYGTTLKSCPVAVTERVTSYMFGVAVIRFVINVRDQITSAVAVTKPLLSVGR